MAARSRPGPLGYLAAFWGVGGVVYLCGRAAWKLAPLAWEPIADGSLAWWGWTGYALSIVFMAYSEGYKGFQKAFAPRVAVRAMHLAHNPRWHLVLLAPAMCMGLFHANKKRLIIAWSLLLGIVLLIVTVRLLPQPWRGIVDAGVVVGLGWGTTAVVVFFLATLAGRGPDVPADLPEAAVPAAPAEAEPAT